QQESANLHKSSELILATREVPGFYRPLAQCAGAQEVETTLSRNSREKLRRSLREYRTRGELIIEEASTLGSARSYFEALKDLHIRSWTRRGKPHAFRFPFFERFHRALIARGMSEGSVQLLRITAGGRPIGYLYNFRHRGRIYAYQSGFDDSDRAM